MSEKHILVEGGILYCSQSVDFNSRSNGVSIKVTSQTLLDANGSKLVATQEDNSVENMNFGKCNDPKYRTPPPCQAKVVWSKMYKGAQIENKELLILTEESEAICNVCSIPGQIKISYHGQEATVVADDMKGTSPEIMENINPLAEPIFSDQEEDIFFENLDKKIRTATIEQINSKEFR